MSIARLSSFCAVIAAAAAIAGCSPDVYDLGHLPTADEIAQIHPGKTTKAEVVKILGTPSSVGVFNDKTWYYVSERTQQVAFFHPERTAQQVYIVDFDNKGVVEAFDRKGVEGCAEHHAGARRDPGARPRADLRRTGAGQSRQVQRQRWRCGGTEGTQSGQGGRPPGPNPQSEED